MLGLFLLLPVLALYARGLPDQRPSLLGLAMGAYGLTQALPADPVRAWSDRYGRKRVIAGGLVLYMAGSLVGALRDDSLGPDRGPAGAGLGGGVGPVTALLADLTRAEVRTRAMALDRHQHRAVVRRLAGARRRPLEAAIGVSGLFVDAWRGLPWSRCCSWLAVPDEPRHRRRRRPRRSDRLLEPWC